MTTQNIVEIVAGIIVSIGGAGFIVIALSSWLGKIWANRLMQNEKAEHARALESLRNQLTNETESYKVKLRKSEFIFEKEYQAASEFVSLRRSFLPTFSNPHMEWEDACVHIAHDLGNIETQLDSYLSKHGAILTEEIRDHISHSEGIAMENKFIVPGKDVSSSAINAVKDMFEKLDAAEEGLINLVRSQSST